jgi:hypothetical protein
LDGSSNPPEILLRISRLAGGYPLKERNPLFKLRTQFGMAICNNVRLSYGAKQPPNPTTLCTLKSPVGYNGTQGFYLFIPASGFGLQPAPTGQKSKPGKKGRRKGGTLPQLRPSPMERPLASVDTFYTVAEEWFELNSSAGSRHTAPDYAAG